MAHRIRPLAKLMGAQLRASDPAELVWLSASAGTGKTHVLTARVLRLLLAGVKPETILCLTFTKAGAAEMADRIHARLAGWVRLKDADLAQELINLGEDHSPGMRDRARTLFASVLDAPGGGLRIQTIHSFCQALLAGFPAEAGLSPGFRPLEGREETALCRRTLAEMLVGAEAGGDLGLIADVQALSLRLGEDKAEAYLVRCAREIEAMEALGSREGIAARVRIGLGLPLGDVEPKIEAECSDESFDIAGLAELAARNTEWGTARGLARADAIRDWRAAAPAQRAERLEALHAAIRTMGKNWAPQDESYQELASITVEKVSNLVELRVRARLAEALASGLRAGQAFARAYADAKRAGGLVDFDDLIRLAVKLLESDGMGDWVRYKLDQATDHILVDEAQDTNVRQWQIVAALAGEFFAGEGAKGSRLRTIFTVGDFKQAIFSFQGTDPAAFVAARQAFGARAADAGREVMALSLDRSFRSTPPVLELVDRLIADLGPEALGISDAIEPHASARLGQPGQVSLWQPVDCISGAALDAAGEEDWLDDSVRMMATRIARQIRAWLDSRLWVAGRGRPLRPEDILILVRKRGALASLIVARLHAEGVPVAGVDRLRLNAPLAVRDLLAAIRFVTQPDDDLSLASLLVSPLFGWDQERLYRVAFGRKASLWKALRAAPEAAAEAQMLGALLASADFTTPHAFLEQILSGPMQGRYKLVARLGEEARDPIEELLSAALGFEAGATPSLQRFLDWFDRGEVDITRDPSANADAVRVMTVHGAKGLQAPLVILADATGDPEASRGETIGWTIGPDQPPVPIFRPRADELSGTLADEAEAAKARAFAEHWRLLYVALTRAEERLVIGGALGPRMKGEPPENSWYAAIANAMAALGAQVEVDPIWGEARHYGGQSPVPFTPRPPRPRRVPPPAVAPDWLARPAPAEARPPRPLAPSSLGLDLVADPPPAPGMAEAARRGTLLHALFERLPPLAPATRPAAAVHWLTGSAGVLPTEAEMLAKEACAILDDPTFSSIFVPHGLAEAPIAAVVGGTVVAGTVDRLLVTDTEVLVVDYKTGRRVPETPAAAPAHHLAQMAAYVAALEIIFPGRQVRAALLYTAGPRLLALPDALIDQHKAILRDEGVEPGGLTS